jgi:hypothetical protein
MNTWNLLQDGAPDPLREHLLGINRRHFFKSGAQGIGIAALASLLEKDASANTPLTPLTNQPTAPTVRTTAPGYAPKAKRVIYLFQNGAPTHCDLFDHKPRLQTVHGQPVPDGYLEGKRFSTMTGNPAGKLMLKPVEPGSATSCRTPGKSQTTSASSKACTPMR